MVLRLLLCYYVKLFCLYIPYSTGVWINGKMTSLLLSPFNSKVEKCKTHFKYIYKVPPFFASDLSQNVSFMKSFYTAATRSRLFLQVFFILVWFIWVSNRQLPNPTCRSFKTGPQSQGRNGRHWQYTDWKNRRVSTALVAAMFFSPLCWNGAWGLSMVLKRMLPEECVTVTAKLSRLHLLGWTSWIRLSAWRLVKQCYFNWPWQKLWGMPAQIYWNHC